MGQNKNLKNKILEIIFAYLSVPFKVKRIEEKLNELDNFVKNHILSELRHINERIDKLYEILLEMKK